MAKMDMSEARAKAQAAKDAAKTNSEAARRDAETRKKLKANPIPKYLDMPEPSGDAEVDSEKDLSELEQGFRRRAADEGRRFALATDSEFWGAICFNTSEQRDAFFNALKVADLGIGGRYFDGNAIAERLGVKLPEADPLQKLRKPDPAWVEFT